MTIEIEPPAPGQVAIVAASVAADGTQWAVIYLDRYLMGDERATWACLGLLERKLAQLREAGGLTVVPVDITGGEQP